MNNVTERASILGMRLLGMGERDGATTVVACKAEIEQLREALRCYGDKNRMASAPAELQSAIDRALAPAKEPKV